MLTIQNAGDEPIEDAEAHVTGQILSIDDLEPGNEARLTLHVQGDSHIRIERPEADPLVLDVYLQRGEPGHVRAVVTADSILSVEHHRGRLPRY
jgi:hypothetical protein